MRTRILPLLFAALVLLMTSCMSNKPAHITYFTNIDSLQVQQVAKDYSLRIKPDDELIITVTSEVPEATLQYNLPLVNIAPKGTVTTSSQAANLQTYIVNRKGDIRFPVLGKVHVGGMTTDEVTDMLTEKISRDVKEPIVRVNYAAFRVEVLGEVNSPGTKTVNKERYTILDAIGDAGDLSIYAKRDNVLLIRDENGKATYHRINLEDGRLLSSPYYYLQQNDVVYVEPNKIRKDNSKYNQNNAYKLSVASTVVSVVSVIASLVIALLVK